MHTQTLNSVNMVSRNSQIRIKILKMQAIGILLLDSKFESKMLKLVIERAHYVNKKAFINKLCPN